MADSIAVETWVEYGIGMGFLFLRLFTRLKFSGVRGLDVDDVFAVLAMSFWTTQTVIIHFLGAYGNNIGLNDETALQVPESMVPQLVLGSKLAFMNWIWYICYIWSAKGVLLWLYAKLTEGTSRRHLVTAASVFCFLTWLACFLTHVCICLPIPRNWQIKPYPGDQCTIRPVNYYVIASLNVATDVVIMLIPIPILLKLHIALPRKIILVVMFSSGIFIMICTILRAYYSLKDISTLSIALGWATRECFVAAIVISLPGIKPLFRNVRWLGASNIAESSSHYTDLGSKVSRPNKAYFASKSGTQLSRSENYELSGGPKTRVEASRVSSAGDSDEYILKNGQGSAGNGNKGMGIHVTTEYELRHEQNSRLA